MAKFRDSLWLWGQSPGVHHKEANNRFNLPGVNRMTPAEGCKFFGISNCCRVVMENIPAPPFDSESETLKHLDNVIWSVVGSGGSTRTDSKLGDVDEVVRQAKIYPNITGGVLDDFLNERRMKLFTPEDVANFRKQLCREVGRKLELWVVLYAHEISPAVKPYLDECDAISLWTWRGSMLEQLEKNLDTVIAMSPEKKHYAGCYMWNYGEAKPLTKEQMEYQCNIYLNYWQAGKIDGIILCSNCIADLGIPEVDWTRQWIAEHADLKRE